MKSCLWKLDDIDWNAGELSVRGKSGQRTELPLPAEVGQAIAAYLRRGRPQSTSRRVFLRVKAPIRGFRGSGGVGSIVRHCLLRIHLRRAFSSALKNRQQCFGRHRSCGRQLSGGGDLGLVVGALVSKLLRSGTASGDVFDVTLLEMYLIEYID